MNGTQVARSSIPIISMPSTISRYESRKTAPVVVLLRKCSNCFDVSMDDIFARCNDPQGKLYHAIPLVGEGNMGFAQFVEMCFDSASPMNNKLKKALLQMLREAKARAKN